MEPCKHEEVIKQWKREIPAMSKWVWKASGAIAAIIIILSVFGKIYIGTIAKGQDEIVRKILVVQEKNETQNKEIQKNMNDIIGIKKDIEYIKESQKRQEQNDEKILDAIKNLKEDE